MLKKGIIHTIPLAIIAILLIGGVSIISIRSENDQKEAVGEVLSSGSGSSGSDNVKGNSSTSSNSGKPDDDDEKSDSSGPGSADSFRVESRSDDGRTKITSKSDDEAKIEIRTDKGRFKTRVKDGEEKTEIRTGGLKIKWERKGNEFILKVKNDDDEDVELGEDEQEDLLENLEDQLKENDIQIATDSADLGFIQRGRKVRTNFPLSINPETGELFVSTPAGDKAVTVLPDVAIQNMIRAGILTRVDSDPSPEASPTPEGTPSATPGGATSAQIGEGTSSATVEGANIELTEFNDQPVYLISGVNSQNLLGIFPVDIKLKAVVSVEDGDLIDIEQGIFQRLLDLISF